MDLDELFDKCKDLQDRDPAFFVKLSMGRSTVEDIKDIIQRMGKVVVKLGDGITLLHIPVKTIDGETPLDQATWKGHVDIALLLLRCGADVDCTTNNGYTPLHRCAFYNHIQLASLICMAGANQKAVDGDGKTAYDVAVSKGHARMAEKLKPIITPDGVDITGVKYERNNPKHPQFRPEAREALLFTLA